MREPSTHVGFRNFHQLRGGGVSDPTGPWWCGPPGRRRSYRVDDLTGHQGGQGLVLRAQRIAADDGEDPVGYAGPVSLKLLTDPSPEQVHELRVRWEILGQLRLPGIVEVLEVFEASGLFQDVVPDDDDQAVCYATSRWVDGTLLSGCAPLTLTEVDVLVADLTEAVTALHRSGIAHRDLHPGNVVITPQGRAVVIDLASANVGEAPTHAPASGVIGFVAPAAGRDLAADDRWGVAMVVAYALVGHPRGTTPEPAWRAELSAALRSASDPPAALELIGQMTSADPERRPADLAAWGRALRAALTGPVRRRRRPAVLIVGAVAATVALAVTATVALVDSGADPSDPAAGRPAGRSAAVEPARQAGAQTVRPAEDFEAMAVSEVLGADGKVVEVLLEPPTGGTLRFTPAMWASYREIAGRAQPTNAIAYGGYPVRVARLSDPDAVVIHLSQGGFLIGPRDDTQIFWLPEQVVELWRSTGGIRGRLGFPASNPFIDSGGLRIEFERGAMTAGPDQVPALLAGGEGVAVAHFVDPVPQAAALGDVRGRILRQRTVTSWYIDEDGIRHWITDGNTWNCLGGDAAVAEQEASGPAVWSFPLGAPARCD